jgi:hypothetical protein
MPVESIVKDSVVTPPAQRLCNEIQLFDLCDLEKCSFKKERFCTNVDLLTAFEEISDSEVPRPGILMTEELEDDDDAVDERFDDAFDDEGYGEEAEYDEE